MGQIEAEDQAERAPTRFPKGASACPGGVRTNGARYRELLASLQTDFNGQLTATETALLGQAAGLLVRGERAKDPFVAVRCANAAQRILTALSAKRTKLRAAPSLKDYLAATAEPAE